MSGLGIASIFFGLCAAGGILMVSGGQNQGLAFPTWLGWLGLLLAAVVLPLAVAGATIGAMLGVIGTIREVARRGDSLLPILGLGICGACMLLNGHLFGAAWKLLQNCFFGRPG